MPNTVQADSHGAARSIQALTRPLDSRLGDADDVAVAPAHPLADRARLALTPYGAVPACNRCSTSSTSFASGLHSAGSPSQDTRAAGSQSVAHKANLLSGCGKVFSALEAAGWRSTYRAPEDRYCRGQNEEPIRMLRGDRLAQLLQRPSCRRIRRHIPMEKTA